MKQVLEMVSFGSQTRVTVLKNKFFTSRSSSVGEAGDTELQTDLLQCQDYHYTFYR